MAFGSLRLLPLAVWIICGTLAVCESRSRLKRGNLEDNIPGKPDRDYPIFAEVPRTTFKCSDQEFAGFYADMEARCQVFHICQKGGRQDSFLCPNGTVFSQQYFVCDWWYNFNCNAASSLYTLNSKLYATEEPINDPVNVEKQVLDPSFLRSAAKDGSRARMPTNMKLVPSGAMPPGLSAAAIDPQASKTRTAASLRTHHVTMATTPRTLPTIRQQIFDEQAPPGGYQGELDEQIQQEPVQHVEEPQPSPRPIFTTRTQKPSVTSPIPSPSRPETPSSPFPSTISIAFPPKPTLPIHQGDGGGDQYNPNDEFGDYPDIDIRFQQPSRVPEQDQPSSVPPTFSRQPQKQPQTLPLKRLPPPNIPQRQQSIPPPPQSLPPPPESAPTPSSFESFEPTPSFQPTPPPFQSEQSSPFPPPQRPLPPPQESFPQPQRPLPPPQRPLPPPQESFPQPQRPLPPPQRPIPPPQESFPQPQRPFPPPPPRPLPPPQESFPQPQRPFPPPQQSFPPPPPSFPPSSSSSFASPPPSFQSQQSSFPPPTPRPLQLQSLPPPPSTITPFAFSPTHPAITNRPEFQSTGFRQHPQEIFSSSPPPPPPPRFSPPPPQITSTLPPPDIFISHPPPQRFSPAPPITFTPPPLEIFSSPPSHPPPPPPRFSPPPPPPPAPISLPPPPVTVFSERPPTPHVSSTTPRPPPPQPQFVSQQTISTPPHENTMKVSVTHFGLPSTTPLPPSESITTQPPISFGTSPPQFSKSVSSTERPSSLQGLRVVPAPNLFLQRPNQGFQPLEGFPQPSRHQQGQNQLNFGLDARKPKLMNQQFPTPPQQFVSDGRPIDLQEIMRFNQIQLQNGQFPNVNHGQLSIHRPSFDTFPAMPPNLQPLPPPFSQQHFGFQNPNQQLLNFRNQFTEQQRFQQPQQGLQQLPIPFKGQQQFIQGPFPQFPMITSNIPLFPQQPQQLQDLRPISDAVQQGQRTPQQTFQFPPQRQPDFQQQHNSQANQQQQQQKQQHQQNVQQQQQQKQHQQNIQQQQQHQQNIQQQQQQQKQQQDIQQNAQQQQFLQHQQKPTQFQQQDNQINAQQNQGPKNIPTTNQEQLQRRPIPLPPPGIPQTFTVAPPPFRDLDEHDDRRPDFPDNDRPDFQDNDKPDFQDNDRPDFDDGDDDQQQHLGNIGNQDLQLDVRDFAPPPPPPPPRPNFGDGFGQQRPSSIPPLPPPPPSRPDFGPGHGPNRPPSIPPPPPPPRPDFGPGPDQQRPSSLPPPPPPRPDFGPGPDPDPDQQRPFSIPPPPPPRPDFGPPGPGQDKPSSVPPPPPPRPDFGPGPDQQRPPSRLPPPPPRPDFGPGFGQERPFSIPPPPRPPFGPSDFGPRPTNPPQHNFNQDRPSSIQPPPPPQQQFPPPPPQQRFPPPPPQQQFPPPPPQQRFPPPPQQQLHVNFEPTTLPPVFIPSSSPVTPEIQIFSEEEKRSKKIKSQRPAAVTPRPDFITSPLPRPPIDDGPQHSTIRPPVDDEFRQPPNFTPRPGISVSSPPPEITTAHPPIIATTPGGVRVVSIGVQTKSTPQPPQFFNQDFPQRPQFGPPPPFQQQEQRHFQNIPPQNFQNNQHQDSFRQTESGFQSSVKGFQNFNTQEQRFQFFRQQDMHANMNVQRPGNNFQGNNNGQFNFQGNNDIQRPDQGRNQFNFQGNNMNIQRPNGNGFQDNFQANNNNFRKPLILDVPNQVPQNKFQQSQQNVQNQNNLQSQQQFHQQGNINFKENFRNNGDNGKNQQNFQNQNNQQNFQNKGNTQQNFQNNQQNFQNKGNNNQQNFQNQNNQQNFQKSQNFQNNFPQDFPRQDLNNKNQGPWNPDRPLSGLNLSPAAFNNNDPNHQKSTLPNNNRQPFVFPFPTLPPIFVPVRQSGEMSVNSLISDIASIDDDGEPKRNNNNQETHQNSDLSSYAPSPREELETKY